MSAIPELAAEWFSGMACGYVACLMVASRRDRKRSRQLDARAKQFARGRGVMSAEIGPHDLVISAGDCEAHGACSCGQALGSVRPDRSLDYLGRLWEEHVMLAHRDCGCEPCSW